MQNPSPPRLQRCLTLAAGPLTDRRTWAVLSAACEQPGFGDVDWMAVLQYRQQQQQDQGGRHRNGNQDEKADPAYAIPLTVVCTFLADRRAIDDKTITLEQHEQWGQLKLPGLSVGVQLAKHGQPKPDKPRPTPTGLRVCDLAGKLAQTLTYRVGLHELGNNPSDLWSEPAARDTAQHALAEAFADKARAALAAAKLPDVLPVTVPADTNSLF